MRTSDPVDPVDPVDPSNPGNPGNPGNRENFVDVHNARDLGVWIARRRKSLGYGLVDAAALCQVGTRFLFELEHGKSTVEFDRALRVAQRLGLRLKISTLMA